MDLGATICTPRNPACGLCPWRDPCVARAEGTQESFPRKAKKKAGLTRYGAAFVLTRADGAVLLRTRPPKGLLGGMAEVPTSEWRPDYELDGASQDGPLPLRWERLAEPVRHVFTHFPLELTVFAARVPAATPAPAGMRFTPLAELGQEPLPGVMVKVLAATGLKSGLSA
jgi:A/G-specific adenine glycosylase